MLSFTLEKDPSSDISLLKLQTANWELNVRLSQTELNQVKGLKPQNQSLQAGQSADAEVFWHLDEEHLIIMVGNDDQSWDFSVSLPSSEAQKFLDSLNQ